MQTTTLGRTGLKVSIAGLGGGGYSRLGQGYGADRADSVAVVREAMDLGVNFVDTAEAYGTEDIIGEAITGRRDKVVISTKLNITPPGVSQFGQDFVSADQLREKLENSLSRLRTDYVDILHLHVVMPDQYEHCLRELVPIMLRFQEQGKIRFLGLTERFIKDMKHEMLARAFEDSCWDVFMPGFSILNPSARESVLAPAIENDIGILNMYAVRRVLKDQKALRDIVADLIKEGQIDPTTVDQNDPIGFLVESGDAESIIEAGYRFCRHEPGVSVLLTGTGNVEHLRQNLAAIEKGPLSDDNLKKLNEIFGKVDSVSGN
mgnify:FL=1